jgi:hypothetical protein
MRATSASYITYGTNIGMDDSDLFTIESPDKSPSIIMQSGKILDNDIQFVVVYNSLGMIFQLTSRFTVCV